MKFFEKFDKQKLFNSRVNVLVFGLLGTIGGVLILYLLFIKDNTVSPTQAKNQQIETITIKPTSEIISEETLWRQSLHKKMEQESKKLVSTIDNLKQDITKTDKSYDATLDKLNTLESKMASVSEELFKLKDAQNTQVKSIEIKQARPRQINQYVVPLENSTLSSDYKPVKTADNYIPAGSFAKAVLLSGVDASTSLNSASDPEPVLIRILDHGNLPRRFKSDLKDCHIIGSSYGDLSSERAKIRLEKLSCTEVVSHEIIETEIAGYVTGEDGRQGIRGTVISTEGKILGNALLSGVLAGFANNVNSQDQSVSLFPSDKTKNMADRLKNSLAGGTSSSLERLSKYYIDRAESLQPIVQVGAGRKIDVVFTEGVFFGSTSIKREIAKRRDEKIKDEANKQSLNLNIGN